ncbi:MAG: 50S ribosomal protein L10 [Candidatus Riesia sp.]|nr:50S ribosomal protein L10 [Candidatus Riesia sp.]
MKNNTLRKTEIVKITESLIETYDLFVIIDFTKVKSIELKKIRVGLNKDDFKLQIIKNSLFRKALLKTGHESIVDLMSGQNLFVFGNNIGHLVTSLRYISKNNMNFKVILAYSHGRTYLKGKVFDLINVKSKLDEIAIFVCALRFVLVKFLRVLKYNNVRLLFLLKSIELNNKKG